MLPTPSRRAWMLEAGLLLAVFAMRAWSPSQPILENYVGRQVPTAMVARNLSRGSGFLRPQLDTGPFPNLFLVEPPVYAQVIAWLSLATSLDLDATGRLVSALSTTLAAWGLFGLVRKRHGLSAASCAVVAFASFPVTIRYGRAFQPDAFAMGMVVAGLRCWDRRTLTGSVVGWYLVAIGLSQKVTWSFVLVPLVVSILRGRSAWARLATASCLVPALAWYLHAAILLLEPTIGSSAPAYNAANWAARLAPTSLLDASRYSIVGRDLVFRSFTPVVFLLAGLGIWRWRSVDRLWAVWTLAAGLGLMILFGKLHHEYYWLMAAPIVAAWVGLAVDGIAGRSRAAAAVCLVGCIALGFFQTRATWRTPREWRDAVELGAAIRRSAPPDAMVVAPEAVIYLGERRGCRLEYEVAAARRAENEWRSPHFVDEDPIDPVPSLVSFYRRVAGARYFADVAPGRDDAARHRLHESVRRDPSARIIDERPGRYLLVEFVEPGPSPD